MKVIIDTNILISAAWKNRTPEEVVLFVIEHSQLQWIASPDILREYREVMARRKFKLSSQQIQNWNNLISEAVTIISVDSEINFPRDRKDAKFIECAISSSADVFITGDKDFSDAKKFVNTIIVSPDKFMRIIKALI